MIKNDLYPEINGRDTSQGTFQKDNFQATSSDSGADKIRPVAASILMPKTAVPFMTTAVAGGTGSLLRKRFRNRLVKL